MHAQIEFWNISQYIIRGLLKEYKDNVAVGPTNFFFKKSNLTHGKIQNHIFYQRVMFQLIWFSSLRNI